jgi:hypothetical protein
MAMGELLREEGSFGANASAKDLAKHLYTRMKCGPVIIVTERPTVLLSALRKQWLKLCRKVQRQSASTLQATRLRELQENITTMQTLRFATTSPADQYPPDVYTATTKLLRHMPECRTLYVTCDVAPRQLELLTTQMPKHSLVVLCRLE